MFTHYKLLLDTSLASKSSLEKRHRDAGPPFGADSSEGEEAGNKGDADGGGFRHTSGRRAESCGVAVADLQQELKSEVH